MSARGRRSSASPRVPLRLSLGIALAGLLGLASCPAPPPPDGEDDSGSTRGASEVADQINVMDDVIAQLAALEGLYMDPEAPPPPLGLCPLLTDTRVMERCRTLQARPHLYTELGSEPTPEPEVDPSLCESDCLAADTPLNCAIQAAEAAVVRGYEDADQYCGCVADDQGRWECLFRTAEALVMARGIDAYPRALDLCRTSGDYEPSCQGHLLHRLAGDPPPLSGEGSEGWRGRRATALQIQIAHAERSPQLASRHVDGYWSHSFMEAFRSTSAVAPGFAAELPAAARRQLRAALAWRLLSLGASRPEGLDARVEWIERALAGEEVLGGTATHAPVSYDTSEAQPPTLPGQGMATLKTTIYLGRDQRVWSEDPTADMAICVLEASARLFPEERGVFEDGLASADPAVRATAVRLADSRADPGRNSR